MRFWLLRSCKKYNCQSIFVMTFIINNLKFKAMKKKLLFTLLSVIAVAAGMSAQDQTAAPSIDFYVACDGPHSYEDYGSSDVKIYDTYLLTYHCVTLYNNDENEVTIYFRFGYDDDWTEYDGETMVMPSDKIEAYAVAGGKLPSEIVSMTLAYCYDPYGFYLYSTCVVDNIHYYFEDYHLPPAPYTDPSFVASVCSRKESQLYSPPYTGNIVIPSEVEIRDYAYPVTGIRAAAFASTLSQSCDITGVELPGTIQEVNPSAFAGCTRLTSMIVHAVEPPYSGSLFEYEYGDENYHYYDYVGFDGNQLYEQVKLFVPNESLEAYRAHLEWGKFTHIIPFIGAGPGDVNGDGRLSIGDVTGLIDRLLGSGELPAYCDVNGDGKVSIGDVTALIDMLLNAK